MIVAPHSNPKLAVICNMQSFQSYVTISAIWSIQKPTNIQCGKPNNEPILESLDQAFQAKLGSMASNTVAFGGRRTRGASCSPTTTGTRIFPECVARVPVSLWGSGG